MIKQDSAKERKPRLQQFRRAADELHKVTARTVFYKLLLIGPMVFMGAIAVQSRLSTESFDTVACNDMQQKSISSYIEPVQIASRIRARRGDAEYVRAVALKWVDMREDGELKPLSPIYYSDSLNEGVKRQIKDAADLVHSGLTKLARERTQAGDFKTAAKDLLLTVQFNELLKYSDFGAINSESLKQRWALEQIEDIAPKLDEKTKSEVRAALIKLPDGDEQLNRLAMLYRRYIGLELQSANEQEQTLATDYAPSLQYALHTKQIKSLVEPQVRRASNAKETFEKEVAETVKALAPEKSA